jgi:heat shock protein HslJ
MFCRKKFSVSFLFFSFTVLPLVISARAQQTGPKDSWLDRPLVSWNSQAGSLPQLPQPSMEQGESAATNRCRAQVRQPENVAERTLVGLGWMLYGPVRSHGQTRVIMVLSGFDGMCRPLGFQAFVHWEGRYAGTLSPVPMNSRTDGALTDTRFINTTGISADFARYNESDALCCPSKIGSVLYILKRDDIPTLTPTNVTRRTTGQTSELANSGPDSGEASLFGKRWTLTEMEERRFSAGEPYIEFDRDQKRVSGSSGCNRFTGSFEIDGSRLKLSRIASTRRACLDGEVQHVEMSFLQLLEATTRFEVQRNTLRLYANDRLGLVFAGK